MSNIDWTQFPAFMLACFWRFIVRSSKGISQTLRWCMETDKGTRVGPLRSDDNMWDWFTIGAQTRGDWRGKSGLWVHARRKAVWHADTHAGWPQTRARVQPYRPRSMQLCVYWGMFLSTAPVFHTMSAFSLRELSVFVDGCCAVWCGQCMKWWVDSDETGRTGCILKEFWILLKRPLHPLSPPAEHPPWADWSPRPESLARLCTPPPSFIFPFHSFCCFLLLKERLETRYVEQKN